MKLKITEEERIEILKSHLLLIEQKRKSRPKVIKPVNVRKPLPGDNTRIAKPYISDDSYGKKIKACHAVYNDNTFRKALDWWRNWLKNPITKEKFQKNWKMDSYTLRDVFKDYEKKLNQVKLIHVFEPSKSALAYVKGSYFGATDEVFVNCAVPEESEQEAINTLIHEIQHILYDIKPLHPKQKIEKSLNFQPSDQDSIWKILSSMFRSNQESSSINLDTKTNDLGKIKSDLKKEGVEQDMIDFYLSSYTNNLKKGKLNYIKDSTEIMSRLYEIRRELKLKPGQDITIQQFVKLINDGKNLGVYWTVLSIIHSGKTLREVLTSFNSYAKNNNYNPQNKNQTFQV